VCGGALFVAKLTIWDKSVTFRILLLCLLSLNMFVVILFIKKKKNVCVTCHFMNVVQTSGLRSLLLCVQVHSACACVFVHTVNMHAQLSVKMCTWH
jgi:hypothetical protein